jgi:hypothetical protein
MSLATEHIGDLTLRRRRAGESLGADGPAVEAHATTCPDCRARIRALDDEQRRFEQQISFDRFAAGVERAARGMNRRRTPIFSRVWAYPVLAMAACFALLLVYLPRDQMRPRGENRIKGGAGITVRVSGAEGQRTARVDANEALARGERLRIGYHAGGHRYLLSLSIDERGEVTPLYPERGASLPVGDGNMNHFLPESIELTDAGLERIIVLLSDQPIEVEAAKHAARAAYAKVKGDLMHLPRLGLPGEEFSRTFVKP